MTPSDKGTLAAVLCIRSDDAPGDGAEEASEPRTVPDREAVQTIVTRLDGQLATLRPGVDLAVFDSIGKAIESARSIVQRAQHSHRGRRPSRAAVRFGLHAEAVGADPRQAGDLARRVAEYLAEHAHAGELRLSGAVHDAPDEKTAPVHLVGAFDIPGIPAPTRVYRIPLAGGPARFISRSLPFEWSQAVTVGILALLASGVIFLASMVKERELPVPVPEAVAPTAPEAPLEPVPIPTGEHPIAVLRLATTQGDDAIEDYLREGLAEDMASYLARAGGAHVLPPDRTLSLPPGHADPAAAAGVLGARFVVSGIAARSPDGLVIDLTVYDAAAEDVIASEHVEYATRDLPKIGALLAEKIGPTLQAKSVYAEEAQYDAEHTQAYDLLLRARYEMPARTQESYGKAREGFAGALALDPGIASAHAHLALLELAAAHHGWSDDRRRALDRAVEHAERAVALDALDPLSHLALGRAQLWNRGRLDVAIAAFERTLEINPNDPAARAGLGFALTWSGNPQSAVGDLEAVIGRNPHHPPEYLWYLSHAYFVLERFEDAIVTLKQFTDTPPMHFPATLLLASALGHSDRTDEGEILVRELIQEHGEAARSAFANVRDAPYRNPADMERFFAGLKKVGWEQ